MDSSFDHETTFGDESTDEEDRPEETIKRKRGPGRPYMKVKEFETKEEALDFIKKEVILK